VTRSALPRWLDARAARLGATLVEAVLEAHGHAGLVSRLEDLRFCRALAAALALPDEDDLERLARALRAGLVNDAARLCLRVELAPARLVLDDGRSALFGVVDEERVLRLVRPAALRPDAERRLGAALLLAHAPRPFVSQPFGPRPAGRGTRELLALALLADLVLGTQPEPALARLALGNAAGVPFGVPLAVYDGALKALEAMLHGGGERGARTAPLLVLYEELLRAEARASPYELARFARREQRFAKDLATRTYEERFGPAVPRRPARRAQRPLAYQPAEPAKMRAPQGDLFAP
jgi:hypothetical protein